MRAIVFERTGEPAEVLTCRDVPAPVPASGEVRVRMLASPINPSDLMFVRGVYGKQPELPAAPGFEGVGVVEESGGGLLGRILIGRRVCVPNPQGGNWAESVTAAARQVIPVPKRLSDEQAATFFVNPLTAYAMTCQVLRVPRGAWLLQTAAGSSLGRMVIRLGRHFDFRTVNVVRREEQIEELKRLGADAVVPFTGDEGTRDAFVETVRTLTGGGVKYAIDPVGGATGSAVVHCLAEGGRLLLFGTLADEPLRLSPRALMTGGASVSGFWLRPWFARQPLPRKLRLLRRIARLIASGVLESDIAETYALENITAAVSAAERPGRYGKVLLRPV